MPNPLVNEAKTRARTGLQKIQEAEELLATLEKSGFRDPDLRRRINEQKARLKALTEVRA